MSKDDVAQMVQSSAQATALQVQSMVKASSEATTAAILEQMAPLLALLHKGVLGNTSKAQSVEQDKLERSRLEHEEEKRRLDEGEEKLQVERSEQARVSALLPPRDLLPELGARLRGGAQRLPGRLEIIERLRQNTGDLTSSEVAELAETLAMGHKVVSHSLPPPTSAGGLSAWGVGAAAQASRSAPVLFGHLQEHGLAAPHPGEGALHAVTHLFKLAGEKEAKKASAVRSFKEFTEFFRKSKVTTRETQEGDPDSFWQMLWHFQSVTHLYTEYGWPVAGEYHARVFKHWQEGFLDLPSMVDTEECRRGDVEGALHQRSFMVAMQLKDGKRGVGAGTTGSSSRVGSDDTLCTFCALWFPRGQDHRTATCRKKKAADKAGKKAC
jgi:hypothetical protein